MMLRHIPGSKDERIRRSPLAIHNDPALGFQPRVARQFEIKNDPDPHHHRIEGFPPAVAVQRWQSVILFQLQRAAAAANIDTLLAVHLRQRLRNFRAHRTHAQCWLLLIEGYGHAAFARRSGNLKANPAAADYRQF